MAKKLSKAIEGNVVKITEVTTNTVLQYNTDELPVAIREKLVPFGAGHKLGDAAANKTGAEAVTAIGKVWEGMMKGEWTTRVPAGEKVSISSLMESVGKLAPKEQSVARALMIKLGLIKEDKPAA